MLGDGVLSTGESCEGMECFCFFTKGKSFVGHNTLNNARESSYSGTEFFFNRESRPWGRSTLYSENRDRGRRTLRCYRTFFLFWRKGFTFTNIVSR